MNDHKILEAAKQASSARARREVRGFFYDMAKALLQLLAVVTFIYGICGGF